MLSLRNVTVKYDDVEILKDISLDVNKGEIISIVGANGAGKSTLLKAIAGLVPVARGSIIFKGKDITTASPIERVSSGIVLVPEGRKIFTSLTVLENLEVGAFISRARPKKKILLEYVFKLFPELKRIKNQNASTISGGEGQMLNIARGLMSDPELILFDEISLGLAPLIVRRLYDAIKEINSKGISVMLVEQNVKQSLSICNRFYLIRSGKIILSGKPQDFSFEEIKDAYFGVKSHG